jgi:hypothetical protein
MCSCSAPAGVVASMPSPSGPLVHDSQEVREIATEAIEPPTHHGIDLATPRGLHQPVECQTPGLGPADAFIHKLDPR